MVKRALLALLFCASFSFAGSIGVNSFSGLDTQDPPSSLQPNQSQDLLNVRLQPGGRSVYKRDGYGLFQTLNVISTATVHGGYHFQQTGGSDVQLWGSDIGLYASVSDSAFVRVATGTVGSTWQCTDNLGFAYCVTSSGVDTPIKTDGTLANTTYQGGIPTGTIIASTPLQLIVAGVSGSPSTIFVSANNNFTSFVTGPLPTDAYQEIINSPGSRLTHLGYYFGNVYWWKDQSCGYMSGSASQGTVGITIVSNQIGTLDNSSAFWNPTSYDTGNKFGAGAGPTSSGNPYFNELQQLGGIFTRGQDNHIYQYDGYNLTRLSRIITPNITTSSRRKVNSWTQTTGADFGNGSSVFVDTFTNPGSIVLVSTSDQFPVSDTNTWKTSIGSATFTNNTLILSTGALVFESVPGNAEVLQATTTAVSGSWIIQSSITFPTCSAGVTTVPCGLSSADLRFHNYYGNGYEGGVFIQSTGPNTWEFLICKNTPSNAFCSTSLATLTSGTPPSDTSPHTLTLVHSATGYLQLYWDNALEVTANDTSNTVFTTTTIHYQTFVDSESPSFLSGTYATFSNFSLGASTGTYYSAVDNAPNLSTWGSFTANDSGIINYYTRSSSNSFSVNSSTPAWTIQPKNSQVAVSTAAFFQARADLSLNGNISDVLSDFTFNWFEGTAGDKAYINYFQDAILFSVSSGSGTSTNNTIFYLDLLNNTFLKDNIPANGFAVENNALYIGDPLSASVYKFGGVTTDKSSPIQSYWKSMDFTGQDPTVQNSWEQADFAFNQSSNVVTFTYAVDQNTSLTKSKLIPLFSSKNSIIKRGFALANGEIGTYYNFTVGDNSSLSPWTLMGQRTTYDVLPWRPQESN